MVTEETTIADFDDEILGANSDNEETSEESPATTEAPSAMTTLPPPPPLMTAEPLGETTTTTESPPTTTMVSVSETTTPTTTTTTTEETITTSTPTPVLEGSPSGDEPVTSSPPSSTDPPITTESTATTSSTTTTEPTITTITEPTTTTTETTTTTTEATTTTTEPTTTTTTEPTTTTTTTEPTTTTTTEPTTTTTTTITKPTTTTTTTTTSETTTTSAPYNPTPAASRFVSRMTAAPIGTPSSTPATNLFDDFNSVYQTAQRREDTDEGSSSLLLISSLRNRLTTPRAERRISDQENDINYQPPVGNSFTSFNLGLDRPSPPLFASSRASVDFPGYTPTQSPYYNTPPRPPRTPVPYVIFGIFPNNTVFRKFPNSNVKEIVSENEIANRQPYYPEQRGNDYDVYRPTAGYSEGRNFSPFVSSVTVTPSTTERAFPGPSESDEEEENHLLLFLSVNRGASSSTEQSEVDVRIGEPSTVVFTSTETPSSIGEPSSLVLVSTEPPSSTTTTTTTTEPSTTTTTMEPSTTTTTTEPSTTSTTTEPSTTTTTTTTEPSTTTTTTEPSTTSTTTEPSTTTTEPSTTTTTTEPSTTTTTTTEPSTTTTTTTTEPSTTTSTTTTEPSTTSTTTEPSTTTTTTEPSTTATSTATVFVVTPAQSDDKPLGAPKSPDSSGKESVPGGKNPPGSLPDISGLGNSLQGQIRSSSPRPTGNQESPSALANRIIEMALQRQKAVTSSEFVGSASTPRSVMVSTAGAENELLRLLGQSAGRLPQSPTTVKGTAPDSTALLALLQNSNKDASKSSQHLLASFSGRQPTQSDLLNKINLGEVLNLAAQMKPSGTATPQGGLRQVFSSTRRPPAHSTKDSSTTKGRLQAATTDGSGGSSGSAQGLVDVAINMTRAMSTLMGQVIQGAAQSLQSFVRERTGNLAKYFSFGSG